MNNSTYRLSFLLFCCASFVACNSSNSDNAKPLNTVSAPVEPASLNGCYGFKSDDLTIQLMATTNGDVVTGQLVYNFAEKDDNAGTIKGTFSGDTLFADYTFMSEGMESVREVAFLKNGDNLKEGYGDVDDQNGKIVFKNRGFLIFPGKVLLSQSKQPCKK